MNIRIFYALFILLLTACSKNNDKDAVTPDASFNVVGLEDIISIDNYDSISIPISIHFPNGSPQSVKLSVRTDIPLRSKVELTETSGTTPFNTTIKLYTYFVANKHPNPKWSSWFDLNVIVETSDGEKYTFDGLIDVNIKHCREMFYQFYLKDTGWITKVTKTNEPVAPGPQLHLKANSNNFYLKNVYLGKINGKSYYSASDDNDISKNVNELYTECEKGLVVINDTVTGYSATDTAVFYITGSIDYYEVNTYNYYGYRLQYGAWSNLTSDTDDIGFEARGKFIFD